MKRREGNLCVNHGCLELSLAYLHSFNHPMLNGAKATMVVSLSFENCIQAKHAYV